MKIPEKYNGSRKLGLCDDACRDICTISTCSGKKFDKTSKSVAKSKKKKKKRVRN
jgi:hypothetical protein